MYIYIYTIFCKIFQLMVSSVPQLHIPTIKLRFHFNRSYLLQ